MNDYQRRNHSAFMAAIAEPDAVNPYVFGGVSFAPDILERVMRTPEDVVRVLAEAMLVHGVTLEDAASRADIPRDRAKRIARSGRATLDEYMRIFEAVGVRALVIPKPDDM